MVTVKPSNLRLSFDNFDDAVSKKFKIKQYLRETLSENYKNCLLVLLDVPNQLTLKSFDLQCKILMTTRNKEVSVVCKNHFFTYKNVNLKFETNSYWTYCQPKRRKPFNYLKVLRLRKVSDYLPKS